MGAPKAPRPPAPAELPPPPPNELDPAVKQRRERFRTAAGRGGRTGSILTTPRGLPSLINGGSVGGLTTLSTLLTQ